MYYSVIYVHICIPIYKYMHIYAWVRINKWRFNTHTIRNMCGVFTVLHLTTFLRRHLVIFICVLIATHFFFQNHSFLIVIFSFASNFLLKKIHSWGEFSNVHFFSSQVIFVIFKILNFQVIFFFVGIFFYLQNHTFYKLFFFLRK